MYITFGVVLESRADDKLSCAINVSPLFAIFSHRYSEPFRKVPATIISFVNHQLSGRIYIFSLAEADLHQSVAKFSPGITVEFEFRLNNHLPGPINITSLAIANEAHNAIRREVVGAAHRLATPEEIEKMKSLVREGMEMGCVGFSTGLMYEPGMWSNTDEVVELAKVVKPFNGTYDSHVRDPVQRFVESDQEAIEVGRRAGIPAKIAHEKTVGLQNAGKNRVIIKMINDARKSGVEVVTDQYPYDGAATSTLTGIVVAPPEMRAGLDLKAALRDPEKRKQIKQTSENGVNGGFAWLKATGYGAMRITSSKDNPQLIGKYLSELAKERKVDPFDLVSDLILNSGNPVGVTLGAIKEEDVRELMIQPWNMIASDGGYSDGQFIDQRHPRSTGTFARVLGHYVREVKLLSLEEAVRKMTSLPADHLAIPDRGRIEKGMVADIVVFDPKTIRDRSTWDDPQLLAEGVHHVLVNGEFVLQDGKMTGKAPGKFLPKKNAQRSAR